MCVWSVWPVNQLAKPIYRFLFHLPGELSVLWLSSSSSSSSGSIDYWPSSSKSSSSLTMIQLDVCHLFLTVRIVDWVVLLDEFAKWCHPNVKRPSAWKSRRVQMLAKLFPQKPDVHAGPLSHETARIEQKALMWKRGRPWANVPLDSLNGHTISATLQDKNVLYLQVRSNRKKRIESKIKILFQELNGFIRSRHLTFTER